MSADGFGTCVKCWQLLPVVGGKVTFHRDHAERVCIGVGMAVSNPIVVRVDGDGAVVPTSADDPDGWMMGRVS